MQTIGERLEDARKQKGISIREAAESTKIRGEYLQKFESNHFDIGLSKIYVRGFLRTYATFLKLPAERILNDYSALGNDEPRTRQPSREIYGRMDVSVASAGDRGDRGAPPAEESSAEGQRSQPKYSRSRTNLPAAPVVVVILLLAWGAKSFFGTEKKPAVVPAEKITAVAEEIFNEPNAIKIIALDPMQVQVKTTSDGRMLLPPKDMVRGESVIVRRTGPVFITSTFLENVVIEENGHRTLLRDSGFKGHERVQLGK
jgi:transcriptional regulator with XRE-family HTH domain